MEEINVNSTLTQLLIFSLIKSCLVENNRDYDDLI